MYTRPQSSIRTPRLQAKIRLSPFLSEAPDTLSVPAPLHTFNKLCFHLLLIHIWFLSCVQPWSLLTCPVKPLWVPGPSLLASALPYGWLYQAPQKTGSQQVPEGGFPESSSITAPAQLPCHSMSHGHVFSKEVCISTPGSEWGQVTEGTLPWVISLSHCG